MVALFGIRCIITFIKAMSTCLWPLWLLYKNPLHNQYYMSDMYNNESNLMANRNYSKLFTELKHIPVILEFCFPGAMRLLRATNYSKYGCLPPIYSHLSECLQSIHVTITETSQQGLVYSVPVQLLSKGFTVAFQVTDWLVFHGFQTTVTI